MSERVDAVDINRTNLACQNCRQRKRRCDRRTPRCGLCARRGLECIMPVARPARGERSLLEDLEEELALLEVRLTEGNHPNRRSEETIHQTSPYPGNPVVSKEYHTQSPHIIDLTILKEPETATLYRGELYGLREMTRRALALDNSSPRGFPRSGNSRGLVMSASRLGLCLGRAGLGEAERDMMATYVGGFLSHVNATFSVVNEDQVWKSLRLLYSSGYMAPESRTQMYLILAIGAAMLPGCILSHVHASAEYFLMATSQEYSFDDTTDTVLILLLLTLYSLLDPSAGSSWQLVDLAMQSCIVLGLHQSQPDLPEHGTGICMGRHLFEVAYVLDFSTSRSLGLPPSIRTSDISYTPHGEDSSFLSVSALYRWAYALSANEADSCVRNYVAEYEAALDGETRVDDSTPALSMFFGYQLAVQSSLSQRQNLASGITNQQFQTRCFPRSWAKTRKPWVVGCCVFEASLVNILTWAALPILQKTTAMVQLKQWLLDACRVVEEISLTFQGLSGHVSLLRILHDYMASPEGNPSVKIQFLERTNLYELCVQALGALEIIVD